MTIKINPNEIPSTVIEAKRWWRREIRRALKATDAEYRADASAAICSRVLGTEEYINAQTVFAYFSVGTEVDTAPIIRAMQRDGKRVCLPRCLDINEDGSRTGEGPNMEAREVRDLADLVEGAYGIPEPVDSDPYVAPEEIDLILLPCLACDTSCRRIGHGAGYYDWYLSRAREDCRTLAVCYEAVLAEDLPVEEHDMPVDAVVTEDAVYRWRTE